MSRGLDFLDNNGAGGKLLGKNRQRAGLPRLAGKRLDPAEVGGLLSVYERGEIRIQLFTISVLL
jgi:hypothetical protein